MRTSCVVSYFWSLSLLGLLHSPLFVHTVYGSIEITANTLNDLWVL